MVFVFPVETIAGASTGGHRRDRWGEASGLPAEPPRGCALGPGEGGLCSASSVPLHLLPALEAEKMKLPSALFDWV